MSALTNRITKVLRAELSQLRDLTDDEWAAHVASVLEAELQLTEECGFHDPHDPVDDEPSGWCAAADYEGMTSRPVSHRRWVSAWLPVPEESVE